MIILGVDPSLLHTGLTIFDTSDFHIIWQGVVNNPTGSSTAGVAPFVRIRDSVKAVIAAHRVEHVYIERMFQSRNPAITEALFNAAFTVKLACYDLDIPVTTVGIMGKDGWKNFVLGVAYTKVTGNLAKKHTRNAIEKCLGTKFSAEHTADAGCIALAGWYLESKVDFRTVLGVPIPEGVGMTPAKPKSMGGRKRGKPKTSSDTAGCDA